MTKIKSSYALILAIGVILGTHFFYYPKWQKAGTEATISWDVSGYYYYLPAYFIYKDVREMKWREEIQNKYNPASSMYQAFEHSEGTYVMKYSAGLALQYLPFFAIGHLMATIGPWDADGFSFPYQLMISLGSLLVCIIGLIFLRKILLVYFKDWIVGLTVLLIAIGTNYLNYTAIDGAMSHNFLFTLYTLLIWATIKFYDNPRSSRAALIGMILGLCTLTRPTEILMAIIPLAWGLTSLQDINTRKAFIWIHWKKYIIAMLGMGAVGFIQLLYWKSVSGDWIVYSYQDQGFSWLRPHIIDGLVSYKKGWLLYTPLMLLSAPGFYLLFKHKRTLFWPLMITCTLIIYITFAWDIWWYGGSLGQRAMVQSYALLAFPVAASLSWLFTNPKKYLRIAAIGFVVFCTYYNGWLTHQAHKGGLLDPENMTKAYFWKVLGKYDQPIEVKKLLDNNEEYARVRQNVKVLYSNDFEQDSSLVCQDQPINGIQSMCIDGDSPYSPIFAKPLRNGDAEWVRAYATIKAPLKEWDIWKMTQMMIRFYNNDQQVKQKIIRLQRLVHDGQTKDVYIDAKCPRSTFDRVELLFWNGGSPKKIYIDDVSLESLIADNKVYWTSNLNTFNDGSTLLSQ